MDAKTNLEKALALNRQLQQQLYTVREKIEKLLKNVKEIYEANEELVRSSVTSSKKKGVGMRGAYLKGGTFYLKGSMFFKDFDCRNCPDNADYHARRREGEMFPRDLDLKSRHLWSYKDKKDLLDAIKEQIIEHLKTIGRTTDDVGKEMNSEKLITLLQMVSSEFRIDWDVISKHNLQHRHSITSCEAIWNLYLHPSLKRSSWTDEENNKLSEIAKKYNYQNWQAIANEIGRRSEFQCFVQYQNYVVYMTYEKTCKWTKEDDERLIEVIERNTINDQINWSNVMVHFPHRARTTLQCRYAYSLNPRISRKPFTPEEDLLLLAAVKEYGAKFSYIPRTLFPNRTTVQLRSRYHNVLMHRHKQQPWTLEDDTKLMDFVTQHGPTSWKKCSEYIQNHSRISCRTRFMVIKRFFEKNPNASLADLVRIKKKRYSYVDTENWTEKLRELQENPDEPLVKPLKRQRQKKPKIKKEPREKVERKRKRKPRPPKPKKPPAVKPPPEPKPKKRRQRKIYIRRLRKNGLILYNSVKYAYDYKLGVDPVTINCGNYSKLHFVRQALQLKDRDDGKYHRYEDPIPRPIRYRLKNALESKNNNKDIEIPNGFSLPTSWSTAMAFRALCIHTARSDLETVPSPNTDDSNEHIQLFRQRFRTLFYTTGLLSRIHPKMVGIGDSLEQDIQNTSLEIINPDDSIDTSLRSTNDETSSQVNNQDVVNDSCDKRKTADCDDDDNNGIEEPISKRMKISPQKKLSLVDQILSIKRKEPAPPLEI
ncbi:uncharacterized protein LOC133322180 [Musca vetustissima]|uniref:uncharacterized protein LOC133322180 n=1 Tax=Musca vetustissima TaxID=27455 RepID=UPI002AB6935A|nr:uncharacterized protein LOC133322180 [Musca vetustissima]